VGLPAPDLIRGPHTSDREALGILSLAAPDQVRGSSSEWERTVLTGKLYLPPVIGHRGAAASAPENTLAGLRRARALGCRWVEFDVRLTADRELVLCHDSRLDRTSDGRGRIARLTLAAIRQYDTGSRFGPEFIGEIMPTLGEALRCCAELSLGANIEIKAERGLASATVSAMAACFDRLRGLRVPILVSSFLPTAVAEAQALVPQFPRGMLFREVPRGWQKTAERFGCATIHADQRGLSAPIVASVRSAGYPVLAYTVNDAARARQLFDWGVTSVFTDAPDILQAG
jgi:glycerophosphoryl diester phosphodiesterase